MREAQQEALSKHSGRCYDCGWKIKDIKIQEDGSIICPKCLVVHFQCIVCDEWSLPHMVRKDESKDQLRGHTHCEECS